MKKILSVVAVLFAICGLASATCSSSNHSVGFLETYPSFAQTTISGVSGCYIIVTNFTADLVNVSATSALSTDVVIDQGSSCTNTNGAPLVGTIGVGTTFGSTDHYSSGPINAASALGGGLCVGIDATEAGIDEAITIQYHLSATLP